MAAVLLATIWIASAALSTMAAVSLIAVEGLSVWRWPVFWRMLLAWSVSLAGSWWLMDSQLAPFGVAMHVLIASWLLKALGGVEMSKALLWMACGFSIAAVWCFSLVMCLSALEYLP